MEVVNLLHLSSRDELRRWLMENHDKEKCCWVVTYRSKCPPEWPAVPYIEVVEEALCFGWIDSTLKRLPDGRLAQRLSPRRDKSHWTQLNMDRCVDLEDRGLMTEAGRQAFESSCKRVSENWFSFAASTAEVQVHEVWLKGIWVWDYSSRFWDKPKDKRGIQANMTWVI